MVIRTENLEEIARYIRHLILVSTTKAGSGHPTSSFSAVELMVGLMFGGAFRFDIKNPKNIHNDRLIFSKGHAAPLLYALYAAAGAISEYELNTFRKSQSIFEGHPRPVFPYAEAATGSLGQGLSIGVGMALNAKYIDTSAYRTYVLLGDSEMAEGSIWEALEIASFYNLDNLLGIIDVNRLGQRGETMYGHRLFEYEKKIKAFGWEPIVVERGHNFFDILRAYQQAIHTQGKPSMIIAKTIKGKGVSFLEDKEGWHGKALNEDECKKAKKEIGEMKGFQCAIEKPSDHFFSTENFLKTKNGLIGVDAQFLEPTSTRKAYGEALCTLMSRNNDIAVLDAEVSNSTYAELAKVKFPERFFEMFIAEQNMVGVGVGLSRMGKIPFISSFGAFLTRAYDHIRMAAYSGANIKFIGSHAGVSIGADGPSQMALEDIAMFRTIHGSTVLYPSDAVSTYKLVQEMAGTKGICYLRTTRDKTPLLYDAEEKFPIGGSKNLRESPKDSVAVITAGITVHEALKAYEMLMGAEGKGNIYIRVIDLYSIKPIDEGMLRRTACEMPAILVVEDHYPEGGIAEAVRSALCKQSIFIDSLAVRKIPTSGSAQELLRYEEIDAYAIAEKVREIVSLRGV